MHDATDLDSATVTHRFAPDLELSHAAETDGWLVAAGLGGDDRSPVLIGIGPDRNHWRTGTGQNRSVTALAGSSAGQLCVALAGPAPALVVLDTATGAPRTELTIDTDSYARITAVASGRHGWVAAGFFAGRLRAGERTVYSAGGLDAFAVAVGPDGTVLWLMRAGGAGADSFRDVASPADGGAILVGSSTDEFRAGPQLLNGTGPRGVVVSVDQTGAVRWLHELAATGDSAALSVVADQHAPVVVGTIAGALTDAPGGALETADEAGDCLVVGLGAGGELAWTRILGGSGRQVCSDVVWHGDALVVAGTTNALASSPGDRDPLGAGDDILLAELTGDGVVTKTATLAGPAHDLPVALLVRQGQLTLVGVTDGGLSVGDWAIPPGSPGRGFAAVFSR